MARMTFNKWFKAQHGERPGGTMSDDGLRELIVTGKNAERIMRERANWDDRYQSALYGWQARTAVGGPCPKKPAKGKAGSAYRYKCGCRLGPNGGTTCKKHG